MQRWEREEKAILINKRIMTDREKLENTLIEISADYSYGKNQITVGATIFEFDNHGKFLDINVSDDYIHIDDIDQYNRDNAEYDSL